jgi:hypothetical protein
MKRNTTDQPDPGPIVMMDIDEDLTGTGPIAPAPEPLDDDTFDEILNDAVENVTSE